MGLECSAMGSYPSPKGSVERARDLFPRKKQIEIALEPVPRVTHESRVMSETLQHEKLQTHRRKRGSHFAIRAFGKFPARRVAGQIPIDSRAYPFRQMLARDQAKEKRQLSTIAEIEGFLPILLTECFEWPELRR